MTDVSANPQPIQVATGKVTLDGRILVPRKAIAVVAFLGAPAVTQAARDTAVAELFRFGIGSLQINLLTAEELAADEKTTRFRNDAELLSQRVLEVSRWIRSQREMSGLPVGYVAGAAAGAGVLIASAQRPDMADAIVSINGRTDFAIDYLREVKAPTLLVVNDMPVLRMNREAIAAIKGEKRIEIIHGNDDEAINSVVLKTVRWLGDKLALVPADAWGLV